MTALHTLALLAITLSTTSAFVCKKTLNKSTAQGGNIIGTYDLCDFVVGTETKDGWYAAFDNRTRGNIEHGGDAVNYTFYFNILSNVAKPPPIKECNNYNGPWRQKHDLPIGYCKNIASQGLRNATCPNPQKNIVPITSMTAAYQAKKDTKGTSNITKCWRLHDGLSNPVWTFLDDDDPAIGIQITYVNGDWCRPFGKNREFKMQFKCANDIKITPDYIETVYEPIDIGCSYEFMMETYKGCPTECIVDNENLCSGHGVCDYDWKRGAPKCFCYLGWYGPDCHDDVDPNQEVVHEDSDNHYVGALVVFILLLLVILFILGYLFLRYTRIRTKPFDFKFLEATKKRRAKRTDQDEYMTD